MVCNLGPPKTCLSRKKVSVLIVGVLNKWLLEKIPVTRTTQLHKENIIISGAWTPFQEAMPQRERQRLVNRRQTGVIRELKGRRPSVVKLFPVILPFSGNTALKLVSRREPNKGLKCALAMHWLCTG